LQKAFYTAGRLRGFYPQFAIGEFFKFDLFPRLYAYVPQ